MSDQPGRPVRISLKWFLVGMSMIVVSIFLLILSVILYKSTKQVITKNLDLINDTGFEQMVAEMDYRLDNLHKIAYYLQNNERLISLLHSMETTEYYRKGRTISEVNRLLESIRHNNEDIAGINIVHGEFQYYSGQTLLGAGLVRTLPQAGGSRDIAFHYPAAAVAERQSMPYRSYKMIDDLNAEMYVEGSLSDGGRQVGAFYIFLNNNLLADISGHMTSVCIVDRAGDVVFRGERFAEADVPSLLERFSQSKETVVASTDSNKVYGKQIDFHDWIVFYQGDYSTYQERYGFLLRLAVVSFLISLIVSFLTSRIVTHKILQPALHLIRTIRRYRMGESHEHLVEFGNRTVAVSLREKIFYYFVLTTLLPICIFAVIYYMNTGSILSAQIASAYQAVFSNASENVRQYVNLKQNLLQNMAYRPAVQQFMLNRGNGNGNEELIYDEFEKAAYMGLKDDTVRLLDGGQSYLLFKYKLTNTPWYSVSIYSGHALFKESRK